jgi:hypothetical protein
MFSAALAVLSPSASIATFRWCSIKSIFPDQTPGRETTRTTQILGIYRHHGTKLVLIRIVASPKDT